MRRLRCPADTDDQRWGDTLGHAERHLRFMDKVSKHRRHAATERRCSRRRRRHALAPLALLGAALLAWQLSKSYPDSYLHLALGVALILPWLTSATAGWWGE